VVEYEDAVFSRSIAVVSAPWWPREAELTRVTLDAEADVASTREEVYPAAEGTAKGRVTFP
jgi:hypothetical protein